ncbi:MAG: DNA primase [Solobacterium sp.]|jgi:DNA primase|nr:DNA primase [Solobacterium sp.]MCH4222963.1 DNA primase [Solobacterium sp.]MCH4266372.1 DNA primase [Solobacterium sp.]
MAKISEAEISELRSKADIVDVIGHYLQVHKKGKSYVALCPFHEDHSPSMSISPDKQIYKCFVCGAGGNVFTFVQNYEKVSFPEAVAKVADLVGFQLSSNPAEDTRPKDPHRESLYSVLNETIRYTMYQMNTETASKEKDYLDQRGLSEEIRHKFEIGYNPNGDVLYQFLKAKGYADSDMTACNVIRTGSSGIHDVFSGRITFPIHDARGNPIGFSARTIEKDNPAKYINTNDTELFSKSDIVYNAHRARGEARRQGKLYVCEGVTDVIAFARAGMDNAVCTLGTSCTEHQIKLLKSLSPRIVFCYDGDEAGQHATWRAAKMARAANAAVTVIDNRTGKDPDEIIRSDGAEALQQLAKREISWMEFALNYLKNHTNLDNYLEKKEFVKKAQAEIAELDDEMDRQHFTDELASISGFHIEYQPRSPLPVYAQPVRSAPSRVPDGTAEAEQLILSQMMAHPAASTQYEEKLGYLLDKDRNRLAMMIVDGWRSGKVTVNSLIDSTPDQSLKDMITDLATSAEFELPYDSKLIDGAIRKIMISVKKSQTEAFRQQLSEPLNAESRELIVNEYQECLRDLRRYIDEENSEKD